MDNGRKTFRAIVIGNSLQKASTGTSSVTIRCRTEYDIENPGVPVAMNIIGNLWLTYKCMAQTIKTLQEVFGWEGAEISEFNEPILTGKKVDLVCEKEEYEGDIRWGIVFFNRPGGLRKLEGKALTELVKEIQPMVDELVGSKAEVTEQTAMESQNNMDSRVNTQEPEDQVVEDDLPF